jgi:four helix bundle protein
MSENVGRLTIQQRTFDFAVRILNLVRAMPHDTAGYVVGRQVARSGTSVGANCEEAHAAHTRPDFAHCMSVARKEACETKYWLRLATAARLVNSRRMGPLIQESDEIVRIRSATVKRAKLP